MFLPKHNNWIKLFRYELWPFGHSLTLDSDRNTRLLNMGLDRLASIYPEIFMTDIAEKDRKNTLRLFLTSLLEICEQNPKSFKKTPHLKNYFIPYSQLNFRERGIIFLRHRFNCTYTEIAFLLSLTLSEVTVGLNDARKHLLDYSGQEVFFKWK